MKTRAIAIALFLGLCGIILGRDVSANEEHNKTASHFVFSGAISGRVYESGGTTPISGASVKIYNSSWQVVLWAYTDDAGRYIAEGLESGEYYVHADGSVSYGGNIYYEQYYNGSSQKSGADLVSVTAPDTVENINFNLLKKGAISGRVTESDGSTPVVHTMLDVYDLNWDIVGSGETNSNGYYTVKGLATGYYYVKATGYIIGEGEFFLEEYYDHAFQKSGASSVGVTAPSTTEGINFALTRGYHVYIDVIPDWGGIVHISPQKLVYSPGDAVTLTAEVGEVYTDYQFDHWSGDASGTDSTTVIVMDADKHVNAHFVPVSSTVYNLVVNVEPVGAGYYIKEPNQTEYDSASVVELSAYPNTGWIFSHWSGDLTGSAASTSIVMNSNKYVTAHFQQESSPDYYLNVSVNPMEAGVVVKNPELEKYDSSAVVELTAIPETGWVFYDWSGDLDSFQNPVSIVMDFDKYITANFGHILETMVYPVGCGAITIDPDREVYEHNEVVQLTANPAEGYSFSHWDGAIDGNENPVSVTMYSNKEIVAVFESDSVTLTLQVSPKEGGWTNPEPGTHTYEPGEVVSITALPEGEMWEFVGWTGSVADPNNPSTTITMDENKIVTANFEHVGYFLETLIHPAGSGTIGVEPNKDFYEYGEVVQLTANPAEGYGFKHWDGHLEGDANPVSVKMDSNKEIIAVFDVLVELNLQVDPHGGGITYPEPGTHSYVNGEVVYLSAYPNPGYQFTMWQGEVNEPYNSYTTVPMNGNKTVTALFIPDSVGVTLTMQVNPEGSGWTNPGYGTYELGDVVTITAEPASGYQFVNWTGSVADPESSTTTITMNENKIVTANFEQVGYYLETWVHPVGCGTITVYPNKDFYEHGEVVQLTANPAEGYGFKRWDGHLQGDANPVSVTMDSNKEIIAVFDVLVELTMNVYPEGGGTTIPEIGPHSYVKGEVVEITANPAEGYEFDVWQCSVADPHNPNTTVTMNESGTVTAKFRPIGSVKLVMIASPSEGGTTDPLPGTYTYERGDTVAISAIPAEGYRFVQWKCYVADPYDPNTVVYLPTDETVTAIFEPIGSVKLVMIASPPEGGTTDPLPGTYTYERGDTVAISAIPGEGYRFVQWKCYVADPYNPNTVVYLPTDETVTAIFEPIGSVNLFMEVYPPEGGRTVPSPGAHTYEKGDTVAISAKAAEGFRFIKWECNNTDPYPPNPIADPYNPNTVIYMHTDEAVTAIFRPTGVKLIIDAYPPEGGTTKPEPGTYSCKKGDRVAISAIPLEGFEFIRWECNSADPNNPNLIDDPHNPNTVVCVNSDGVVMAIFEPIGGVKLIMKAHPPEGGTTEPVPGMYTHEKGDRVAISAIAAEGYQFIKWECHVFDPYNPDPVTDSYNLNTVTDPYNPNTTVHMDTSQAVIAIFEQIGGVKLIMDVRPPEGGRTEPVPGMYTHEKGDRVAISAIAAEGYQFIKWECHVFDPYNPDPGSEPYDPKTIADPYSPNTVVHMDTSQVVIAMFEQIGGVKLIMDVRPPEGGRTEPAPGMYTHEKGDRVAISAIAAEGYQFIKWECHVFDPHNPDPGSEPYDPKTIEDPYSPNTVVHMDTSQVVFAIFEQIGSVKLIMDVHPPEGGRTEPVPGMYTYEKGDRVAISAIAAEGYQFIKWECHVFDPYNPDLGSEPYDPKTIEDPYSPNTVVHMDTSQVVFAVFEQIGKVNLFMEVRPPEGGMTKPEPGRYTHDKGDTVSISAIAAQGYQFIRWECYVVDPYNPSPNSETYDPNTIADPYSPNTVVYMNTSQVVIAVFQQIGKVNLIMEVHPPEGGKTRPEQGMYTHDKGDTVSISAIAAEGYQFIRWECHVFDMYNPNPVDKPHDPNTIADPYSPNTVVYLDTSQVVIAIFEQTGKVNLFMAIHPYEGGKTRPEQGRYTYNKNDTVSISAIATEGYRFIKWECHVVDIYNPNPGTEPYDPNTIADPYNPNTVVYMDTSQVVIAVFEMVGRVKLMIGVFPPEGGKTEPEPGRYAYEKGDTVSIYAIPAEGYRFIKWECHIIDPYNSNPPDKPHSFSKAVDPNDPNKVDDPYSPNTVVYMDTSQVVIAVFEMVDRVKLIMELYPPVGGKTEPHPGMYTHEKGDTVSISAIAADGYNFVKWECYVIDPYNPNPFDDLYDLNPFDDSNNPFDDLYNPNTVADPYSPNTVVYMDTTQIVIALFKPIGGVNFIMVVYPPKGGKTRPEPGMYNYEKGDTVSISAVPAVGYQFIRWECKVIDLLNDPNPFDNSYDPNTIADPYDPNTVVYLDTAQAVIALFEAVDGVNLIIDAYPPEVGTTEPEPGTHTYRKGEVVILEAIPKDKFYHFAYWEGDVIDPYRIRTMVKMDTTKTVTAHFEFGDNVPPHMFNCFPRPQSTEIPKNTRIKFNMGDIGFGVDLMTLDTWVNDLKIIDKGLDQTGGQVSIRPNSKSYKIFYDPDEDFEEGSMVSVHASCYDLANPANYCDSSYSFTIGKAKIDTSAKKVLGEEGGTVSDTTSGVEINVPANALIDSVEISINQVEDPPPLPDGVTGIASSLHFGPDGLQFNEPVTIQIPYTQADLRNANVTSPEDLRIFYFHTSTGEWIELTVDSVDVVNMIIYVTVNEFCYFTFGYEEETSVNEQRPMYESTKPADFALSQNYPNPFNPETHIQYQIPEPCNVTIVVYNTNGRLIRTLVNEQKPAGSYEVVWDGKDGHGNIVSSGVYLFKMRAKDQIFVRKVSFQK